MTYTVSNPYSVSIAPSEIATAPFGAVTNAPLTRTIPGTLWLNGGSFNIGSGNKLIMANSSVIRRSSTIGTSQFTVNSGFYSVGVIATDLVNILIDANGTVIGSSEMRSSPAPGGFGNLTISPSTAKYNTSGARTVVNLINDGNLILAPTTTSTFTVTGNFTGTGTITSGNSNASITVGSASSTGDAGTIYFDQTTNGVTNAFNNFKIDRTLPGAAGSVTIANSLSFKGNFQQSNGIVNLAPGTTFTLLGTTSNSNGSLRGNNTANISIGGTGALGNLYFDQTTPGTTNLFNNFTLNRTASGSATIGSDIIIGGTTTLTNGSLNIASSKTLTIGGNFTNNSGTGTLGGAADDAIINTPNLTITGSGATFNPLKFTPGFTEFRNLIFDRSATIDATASNGLRIQGTLNLNNASTTLTTSDNVILRSTSAGSARLLSLSAITTPFAGSFTAERYIPANANRAWRLLSVPTGTTQTINASWQNGQTPGVQGPVGKGTWVTSFLSTALANNYDAQSPNNYSLKTYISSTGTWDGVSSSTTTTNIATDGGYMLFVRGDRTATNFGSTITATTLSTKGPLKYGNYPVTPITINANKFEIIGNPYPSAIDLRAVTRAGGTDAVFYVWDPKILPMGAFQTLTFNGTNYIITPGGGNYLPGGTTMDTIQSGQAFMAHATGANGTIQFTEACKSGGTRSVFRPTAPSSNSEGNLITNLYTIRNGSKDLSDGTLTIFGNTFSNNVNGSDAKKLTNFNVNLGMKRDDQILAVEKREDIGITDTIFYNLTKPVISNYKLEIVATNLNHPNLTAKLVDAYLNRSTSVNLNATTTYDFNVINDAGSYAANRFMLVMYQSGAVPINQLTLQATKQNKQVALEWKAANQINIEQYEIETSGDSINFTKFAAMPSTGGNGETVEYNWLHEQAVKGNNYYRIKSIGKNGAIAYSNIVKIKMGDDKLPITVFPNLVTNNTIKLQFTDLAKGTYSLVLVNNAGQVMFTSQLVHSGGSAVYPLEISKSMGSGKYNLQVINPGKTKIMIPIIIAN